jgi:NhaA family Na+:H+ antiporter
MLLSLAIVDDIGAILVIAVGYTESIGVTALALGIGGLVFVAFIQRLGVRSVPFYAVIGALIWFAFHESGVHATIAGVALGLLTPTGSWLGRNVLANAMFRVDRLLAGEGWDHVHDRKAMMGEMGMVVRETVPPLERLETRLHPWVSFVIMPVFALANAGIPLDSASVTDGVAVAVIAGLVIGKPLGIMIFSAATVGLKIGELPEGVNWPAMVGAGFLAGIGFTMAMFIASLAVEEPLLSQAKIGVLAASAVAAIIGCLILVATLKKPASSASG